MEREVWFEYMLSRSYKIRSRRTRVIVGSRALASHAAALR